MIIEEWNEQRSKVFEDRYALHEEDHQETSCQEMWVRVSDAIGFNEGERLLFYRLLKDFQFLPAGRILSGAGSKQHAATYYNCFVLGMSPLDLSHGRDSRDAIMSTITKMIEINCRGGGIGLNWSTLRPSTSEIRGVHGYSTGPAGWMRGADAMADQVRQGGSRTAALMFMMDVWHPDIMNFVTARNFLKANFSVAVSDEFMRCLYRGGRWKLEFPDTQDPAYDILWDGDFDTWKAHGRGVKSYGTIPAKKLWKAICESAAECGSPGIVFLDTCNGAAHATGSERLICTNPCGEQPLPEYGSCNLGSINLVAMCNDDGHVNKPRLGELIPRAIRFLDNVIDKTPPIFPEIDNLQDLYRRIGLGTTGLADVLILNKIKYGSPKSLSFIDDLYGFIANKAYEASALLAAEKGAAPLFNHERFFLSAISNVLSSKTKKLILKYGLRNTAVLTQAPAGTISILAGVSSGIEPIFSADYTRTDATGTHFVSHPLFKDEIKSYHVTAHDIHFNEHVRVQAQLQRYVDSSISKTINLPKEATWKEVDQAYRMAHQLGCKGVTVYRDGSLEDSFTCTAESCN